MTCCLVPTIPRSSDVMAPMLSIVASVMAITAVVRLALTIALAAEIGGGGTMLDRHQR